MLFFKDYETHKLPIIDMAIILAILDFLSKI